MSDSVFIGSANLVFNILDNEGIDPVSFIEKILGNKVDFKKLNDPNARVDYKSLEKVWQGIYNETKDECLALTLVKHWHPGHLGALGHAWLSSQNLSDAFKRLERFVHMISKRIRIKTISSAKDYTVIIERENINNELHFLIDGTIAVLLKMCRMNAGENLNPILIEFTRPQPSCTQKFENYFQCPMIFSAKENKILFSNEDVNKHLTGSNPVIAEVTDRIVTDYLARMNDSNIIDQVKSEILNQLPSGKMTETSIANSLHKSLRTMQRLLDQNETSFSELVKQTRYDLAIKYIGDTSLSLTEIAYMLGFSESSSFSRAFKRWTGTSPNKLRS